MIKSKVFYFILFFFSVSLLSGCGTFSSFKTKKEAVETMPAHYASSAINLTILASNELNTFNNMANSCPLLILQSDSQQVLQKIMNNPLAIRNLLEGGSHDGELLQVDRYPIMPGNKSVIHVDRVEFSRYIAIIAGYYPFPTHPQMRLYPIPYQVTPTGFLWLDWHAQLLPLDLVLHFGNHSIIESTQIDDASIKELSGSDDPSQQYVETTATKSLLDVEQITMPKKIMMPQHVQTMIQQSDM